MGSPSHRRVRVVGGGGGGALTPFEQSTELLAAAVGARAHGRCAIYIGKTKVFRRNRSPATSTGCAIAVSSNTVTTLVTTYSSNTVTSGWVYGPTHGGELDTSRN